MYTSQRLETHLKAVSLQIEKHCVLYPRDVDSPNVRLREPRGTKTWEPSSQVGKIKSGLYLTR